MKSEPDVTSVDTDTSSGKHRQQQSSLVVELSDLGLIPAKKPNALVVKVNASAKAGQRETAETRQTDRQTDRQVYRDRQTDKSCVLIIIFAWYNFRPLYLL